jgi:hypothetical protein
VVGRRLAELLARARFDRAFAVAAFTALNSLGQQRNSGLEISILQGLQAFLPQVGGQLVRAPLGADDDEVDVTAGSRTATDGDSFVVPGMICGECSGLGWLAG